MLHHLIVYVPVAAAQSVRDAMAASGAGRIGNYDSCSFSSTGTGRFRPLKGASPAIGSIGTLEEVEEERIEAVVNEEDLKKVLEAIVKVHPYEEPAIHVLPMQDYKDIMK
ncbi:MAG: hypothetical protein Q7S29_01165 [Candidatus Peribacter sp.]|nr:hypothetical protein [Candidatus Peribacter sp.]